MKAGKFVKLAKLHLREGLNVYLTDSLETELQCQLCGCILQNATLRAYREDAILAEALWKCGLSLAETKTVTLSKSSDNPPVSIQGKMDADDSKEDDNKMTEDFWDDDLDPSLLRMQPKPPRFPMPPPPPVFELPNKDRDKEDHAVPREKPRREFTIEAGDPRKLFVRNVSYKVSQKVLWDFFKPFGSVVHCKLLRDKISRRSKGSGYVIFSSEEVAEKVLKVSEDELTLDGRKMRVERAIWKKYVPRKTDNDESDSVPRTIEGGNTSDVISPKDEEDSEGEKNIINLPDEIMLHLLSFLTLSERLRAERVCKKWRNLSLMYWQSMKVLDFTGSVKRFAVLTERILQNLLKRGSSQLQYLDVSFSPRKLADGAMECIAQRCPNLTHLNLTGASQGKIGMRKLAEGCRKLQWIRLRGCFGVEEDGLWWLFHRCKDLCYVDLAGSSRLKGSCLHVLGQQVETLILNDCNKLQESGLRKIGQGCPRLLHLELNGCVAPPTGLVFLLCNCPSLEILHLSSSSQITPFVFRHLRNLCNLKEVYVSGNPGVDDSVLEALGRGCGQLRVLDITSCHQGVTDAGLEHLAACSRLQELHLSYMHQIAESGLVAIAHNAKLVKLVARGCSHVTEGAVTTVVDLCYDLEHLDLCGCVQLGNTVLSHIVAVKESQLDTTLSLYIGGTSMDPADNSTSLPSSLRIHLDDLCMYHRVPDRDLVLHLGDSDEDEDADPYDFAYGGADGDDFLENDDPLAMERWEMS